MVPGMHWPTNYDIPCSLMLLIVSIPYGLLNSLHLVIYQSYYEYISTKSRDVANRVPNLLFETNFKILLSIGMYE